jgi:phosphate starvation-inducible protein PhoH
VEQLILGHTYDEYLVLLAKSGMTYVDATKAHDITLAGGASFNGGTFLAVAVMDRALKGSMAGERMNKIFGRGGRRR